MEIFLTKVMNIANGILAKTKSLVIDLKNDAIESIKDSKPMIRAIIALVLDFLYGNKAKYTYAFLIGFFFSSFVGYTIVFIAVLARKLAEIFFTLEETNYKIAIAIILGALLAF